jgi:hypothetical protein
LTASLALDTPAEFLPGERISLPGSLTGDGTFRLGANAAPSGNDITAARSPGGTAQAVADQTAAQTSGAASTDVLSGETGQASVSDTKDAVPVIAILDEIIITVTTDAPVSNKTQTAAVEPQTSAPEETPSFAVGIEETAEEKTDTGTSQTGLRPEPAAAQQSKPEDQRAVRQQPSANQNPARTAPTSDRSRGSTPARTPAASAPQAEDTKQAERGLPSPAGTPPDNKTGEGVIQNSSAETSGNSGKAAALAPEITYSTGTDVSR